MKTLGRFWTTARRLGQPTFALLASLIFAAALAGIAFGDILELRDGQIIQGQFIGGSPANIRFRVNGQEQIFATKDVLNIGFSDSSDASNSSAAPSAQPAPQSTAPQPDNAAPSQPAAQPPPPTPSADTNPSPSPTEASAPPPPATAANAAPAQGPPPQASPSQQPPSATATTQAITIPAGTSLFVRMIDSIDSSKNNIGDPFHGSLESALVVGDIVVAPAGADVYGKLTQAKEAGKISGGAQLTLELTGVRINGNIVPVDSTDYDVAGKGRGGQSAERIGGGAVLGTIIGAIAGGGKGAAIGGVVGAGAGTAVQVSTKGDKVRIPSETLLEFKLQQDVTAPLPAPSN
jgi:hypothetical protein